jgi:hypothetical protein
MDTNFTQQEIMLITGTGFLSRQFRHTSGGLNSDPFIEKEKLKVACRNGLLSGMLPEIVEEHSVNRKLHLWEMLEGSFFIELKSEEPHLELEMQFSIDPYSFLAMLVFS